MVGLDRNLDARRHVGDNASIEGGDTKIEAGTRGAAVI
jgi:hypothetical protein